MSIETIISAWKADEDYLEATLVASPVGQELTEEELLEVSGADCVVTQCGTTCNSTGCIITNNNTNCFFLSL